MNLTMYSDSEKNLMMFLPDDVTDEEILTFGQMTYPDEMFDDECADYPDAFGKPTCFLNLNSMHASFPVGAMYPNGFLKTSF